ncbi:hypothetical protein KAR91_80685 [Candidatus Pacearchaeota archaeon]|nr:hypothetical protein [Candidatus Pacearchaeota archaeon]
MKHSKDETVIHLNKQYAFDGDALSVTLYEKRVSDKGNLGFFCKGHYNNVADMFYRLIDHDTNSCKSIQEIVDTIDKLKEDIFHCILALSQGDKETLERMIRPEIKAPTERSKV